MLGSDYKIELFIINYHLTIASRPTTVHKLHCVVGVMLLNFEKTLVLLELQINVDVPICVRENVFVIVSLCLCLHLYISLYCICVCVFVFVWMPILSESMTLSCVSVFGSFMNCDVPNTRTSI